MSQSKRNSLVETLVNTGTGFFISFLIQEFVIPLVSDHAISLGKNMLITTIFTAASIARGYYVRRFFNRYSSEMIAALFSKAFK